MRLQHSVSPPPPGRGRTKRKRGAVEEVDAASEAGTGTGKPDVDTPPVDDASLRPPSPTLDDDEDDHELPAVLGRLYDPTTGLVAGRSVALAKYIIVKAKAAWIRGQHEALIEELRVARAAERDWREAKDAALNELMLREFGPGW
jgi:hypothetical protein